MFGQWVFHGIAFFNHFISALYIEPKCVVARVNDNVLSTLRASQLLQFIYDSHAMAFTTMLGCRCHKPNLAFIWTIEVQSTNRDNLAGTIHYHAVNPDLVIFVLLGSTRTLKGLA